MIDKGPRVIVALDFPEPAPAFELAERLSPKACRLKVGKELFVRGGPRVVETLQSKGFEVFLDLKFHDIPNTVAAACRAAAELGVWMVNVHALGGRDMMLAAREAVGETCKLIAVTVLTSMDDAALKDLGFPESASDMALRLAGIARESGMGGVVCSAQEAAKMKQRFGPAFELVTPGIRPASTAANDQKRIMTPADALAAGSDYLVIGRPITQAEDPLRALNEINQQIRIF